MKYLTSSLALLVLVGIITAVVRLTSVPAATPIHFLPVTSMQLSSTAFEDNGMIPAQYTCDGENTSPPLVIEDVPADAGSLALVVHDPDAPAGDWAHWLVWNIPPDTSRIGAGALPERAVQGITDFRVAAWGGPCPPNGEHRYIFTVYALDRSLDLPAKSRKADLERALEGNVVGTAQLVGRYSRS